MEIRVVVALNGSLIGPSLYSQKHEDFTAQPNQPETPSLIVNNIEQLALLIVNNVPDQHQFAQSSYNLLISF